MKTRPIALALCGGLLLPCLAAADTVIMKTGRRLTCKVIPPAESDTHVRVILDEGETGSMLLVRDRIKRIEYDYDSRLDALATDDFSGHYTLGVWCLKRALYPEAIERLRHALGNPGVPLEVWFYLARALEEQTRPALPEALKHYQTYLDRADTEAKRRKEAAAAVTHLQKRIKALGLGEAPEQEEHPHRDGLEAERWTAPQWGNDAVVDAPAFAADQRNKVLRIRYKGVDHHGKRLRPDDAKAPVQLALGARQMDFTTTPVVQFRARTSGEKPIRFSVAVTTGKGYQWFESKLLTAPADRWSNPLSVDLTHRTWKSEASNWNHTTAVEDQDRVRNLLFVIYNGRREGTVFFEGIQRAGE